METSADLGGKSKALNANYLLTSMGESGKDLHTFLPVYQVHFYPSRVLCGHETQ